MPDIPIEVWLGLAALLAGWIDAVVGGGPQVQRGRPAVGRELEVRPARRRTRKEQQRHRCLQTNHGVGSVGGRGQGRSAKSPGEHVRININSLVETPSGIMP